MTAKEARGLQKNSNELVRENCFRTIRVMAENGSFKCSIDRHYPELIEELLSKGYNTIINDWGNLEIDWLFKE